MTSAPTERLYGQLSQAYSFFNTRLFDAALPPCVLTLQRRRGAYGCFAAERFVQPGESAPPLDELALNPALFAGRSAQAILSTLVQEMVQVWQRHYGQPSRSGYFNREWAGKMKEIGLIPSDTGQPGGKETGQQVRYYVEAGGAFERACRVLLASGEVVLYPDRERAEEDEARTARKTHYACSDCGVHAWAKPEVSLRCGKCDQMLQVVPSRPRKATQAPSESGGAPEAVAGAILWSTRQDPDLRREFEERDCVCQS